MSIEKGPDMRRRNFLKGTAAMMAAAAIPKKVDALAVRFEKKPGLEGEILSLQEDLSRGGRYYKILQNRALITDKFLTEIRTRMTKISTDMQEMHSGRISVDESVAAYVYQAKVPGLMSRWIDSGKTRIVNGTAVAIKNFCNEVIVESRGRNYATIPYHCIAGAPEEKKYSRLPEHDIAARQLSDEEYSGLALPLDENLTADKVNGMFGVTVGEKGGITEAFYGHLVRMTPAFYEYLFTNNPVHDPDLASAIQNGFWKMIPPEQYSTIESYNGSNPVRKGHGRSGSVEIAYDPTEKKYTGAGRCIAIWTIPGGPLEGMGIGFYSTPEPLQSVIEAERSGNPPKPVEKSHKIAAGGR